MNRNLWSRVFSYLPTNKKLQMRPLHSIFKNMTSKIAWRNECNFEYLKKIYKINPWMASMIKRNLTRDQCFAEIRKFCKDNNKNEEIFLPVTWKKYLYAINEFSDAYGLKLAMTLLCDKKQMEKSMLMDDDENHEEFL